MTALATLSFPPRPAPAVTVSVLAYGPSPWLEATLSALHEHTADDYEVVIVDNGATGPGRAVLDRVAGARVLRPGRNLGFGAGHSLAARHARAPLLCLLNSDALVPAGWLPAMTELLERDPALAAVAPVLVGPDGRLLEAGAAVEPSGLVVARGRGRDPGAAALEPWGPVPFASAACLLVRRAVFDAVGGFDPGYGPAYYEDVDFAFALLARGYAIGLAAGVRVVHAEGASSETPAAAERRLLGNRERFRAAWSGLLAGRPVVYGAPGSHHPDAARDFDLPDRVLVVAAALPPASRPTPDRTAALLVALRDGLDRGRVVVAAPVDDPEVASAWRAAGVEVVDGSSLAGHLRARRFHYAAIVTAAPLPPEAGASLAAVQPQATLVEAPAAETVADRGAFASWLSELGLTARALLRA